MTATETLIAGIDERVKHIHAQVRLGANLEEAAAAESKVLLTTLSKLKHINRAAITKVNKHLQAQDVWSRVQFSAFNACLRLHQPGKQWVSHAATEPDGSIAPTKPKAKATAAAKRKAPPAKRLAAAPAKRPAAATTLKRPAACGKFDIKACVKEDVSRTGAAAEPDGGDYARVMLRGANVCVIPQRRPHRHPQLKYLRRQRYRQYRRRAMPEQG